MGSLSGMVLLEMLVGHPEVGSMSVEVGVLHDDVEHANNPSSSLILRLTAIYCCGYLLIDPRLLRLGHIFQSTPTSRQNPSDNPG